MKERFEREIEQKIEKILHHRFTNKKVLFNAFCHSSFANNFSVPSNERLEFLGDTILNFIISERICMDVDYMEGGLSKLRSKIVSEVPLAALCEKLGLDKFLLVGNGSGKMIPSQAMKADLIEAIICAIYIDGGLKGAKKFIFANFEKIIERAEDLDVLEDAKSLLQEKLVGSKIKYVSKKTGSEHKPTFSAEVLINGVISGRGVAKNKKIAEQFAAGEALKNITKV